MPKLLIELLSEEMPAGLQEPGARYLRDSFLANLDREGLKYGESRIFWSPMRLCLIIQDVSSQTEDINIEKRGPRKGDAAIYARATGFETMLGWLFLKNPERLAQLLDRLEESELKHPQDLI